MSPAVVVWVSVGAALGASSTVVAAQVARLRRRRQARTRLARLLAARSPAAGPVGPVVYDRDGPRVAGVRSLRHPR